MEFRVRITPLLMLVMVSLLVEFNNAVVHGREEEDTEWHPATATWYGAPDGSGSDGGACGYGNQVDVKPFKSRTGAVSPVLFKGGEGCGGCYKVKCTIPNMCAKRAVTIIVTDECPGGYCSTGRAHFDLSGATFARMAVTGKSPNLLNAGALSILYRKVPCKYPGKGITFKVNEGATDYWFSVLIEYEDGDGEVGSVQLKEAGSSEWMSMKQLWGANWALIGGPFKAPYSLRVTELSANETLTMNNVIPADWHPSVSYKSSLNFED